MRNPFAYQSGEPYVYRPPDDPQRLAEEHTLLAMLSCVATKPKTSGERWIERELYGMTDGQYDPMTDSWVFSWPMGTKRLSATDFAAHNALLPPRR